MLRGNVCIYHMDTALKYVNADPGKSSSALPTGVAKSTILLSLDETHIPRDNAPMYRFTLIDTNSDNMKYIKIVAGKKVARVE
ncbi:UNVERIFIED_CONTAM: hypothetical protein K2H54_054715 [Gekko kuhli]